MSTLGIKPSIHLPGPIDTVRQQLIDNERPFTDIHVPAMRGGFSSIGKQFRIVLRR
jgi:hypothetical protein